MKDTHTFKITCMYYSPPPTIHMGKTVPTPRKCRHGRRHKPPGDGPQSTPWMTPPMIA